MANTMGDKDTINKKILLISIIIGIILSIIVSGVLIRSENAVIKEINNIGRGIFQFGGTPEKPYVNYNFTPTTENGYAWKTTLAPYTLWARSNSNWGDGIRYCTEDKCLTYQAQDIGYRNIYNSNHYLQSIQGVTANVERNRLTYNNVFTNVNLEYVNNLASTTWVFEITEPLQEPASWLGTQNITLDFGGYIKFPNMNIYVNNELKTSNFLTQNRIEFRDNNETLFFLPEPYVEDSSGNRIDLTYRVNFQGNDIFFYIKIPYEWLSDETRVYPILVTGEPTAKINLGEMKYENNDLDVIFELEDFADEILRMELKSHSSVQEIKSVGGGNQVVMYYDVYADANLLDVLGEPYFIDMKTEEFIERNWNYVYWTEEDKVRDICLEYDYIVINETNEIECILFGEEDYLWEGWVNLDNNNLPFGQTRIGLKVEVLMDDWVDGVWEVDDSYITLHAKWLHSLTTDLISWWSFDNYNTTTKVVEDEHGDNLGIANDGRVYGTSGVVDLGLDLTKGTDLIEINNSATNSDLALTWDEYTISFWVKASVLSGTQRMINKDNGNNFGGGYDISWTGAQIMWAHNSGVTNREDSTFSFSANTSYYLTFVYEKGARREIWINGALNQSSNKYNNNLADRGTDKLNFGYIPVHNQHFNGLIDEIGMWNRSLSQMEIEYLYNEGNGITYSSGDAIGIYLLTPENEQVINESRTVKFSANITNVDEGTEITQVKLVVNNTVVLTNTSGLEGIYNFTRILDNSFYEWYINVTNNETDTFQSEVWNFTVDVEEELKVTLLSPANNFGFPYQEITLTANVEDVLGVGIKNVSLLINDSVEETIFDWNYSKEVNHGTVSGGVTIEDGAMKFDGVDGIVNMGDVSSVEGIDEITISTWLKMDDINQDGRIIRKGDYYSAGASWSLSYFGTTKRIAFSVKNERYIYLQNGITLNNTWYHINFVYSKTTNTSKLYINGILRTPTLESGNFITIPDTANDLIVGGTGVYLNGSIDDVLIFNRTLSQDEITQLYEAGRGSYAVIADGLIAQYSGRDYDGTEENPTFIKDTRKFLTEWTKIISEGTQKWRVIAYDDTYDEQFTSGERNVIIDITEPDISITSNPTIMDFSVNHTINFIATDDNLDSCWLSILRTDISENSFFENSFDGWENVSVFYGTPQLSSTWSSVGNYSLRLRRYNVTDSGGGSSSINKIINGNQIILDYKISDDGGGIEIRQNGIVIFLDNGRKEVYNQTIEIELGSLIEIGVTANLGLSISVYIDNIRYFNITNEIPVPCTSGVETSVNFSVEDKPEQIAFYVNDTVGNLQQEMVYLTYDEIPPTINSVNLFDLFSDEISVNSFWRINATDDNLDSCWYNTTDHVKTDVDCNDDIHTTWTTEGMKEITFCANDTINNIACETETIRVTLFSTSAIQSKDIVGEGDMVTFTLTIEGSGVNTEFSQTTAEFEFDGDVYSPTSKNTSVEGKIIFTKNFIVPSGIGSLIGEDIDWEWNYNIKKGSVSVLDGTKEGDIKVIAVMISDDCGGWYEFLEWSLYDQQTRELVVINNESFSSVEIDLTITSLYNSSQTWIYSETWTDETTMSVCVPEDLLDETSYRIDWIMGYDSTDRVREFHYLDNGKLDNSGQFNSHTLKELDLYNLKTVDSTTFLFKYTDEDNRPVPNAIVHVYRKYIGDGVFLEVERGKQDSGGDTHVHLVEEDIIYYFMVTNDGEVLFTSSVYNAKCLAQPCQITLSASQIPTNWSIFDNEGGKYIITSDKSTRTATVQFNLEGEISTITGSIFRYDGATPIQITNGSLTASQGSIDLVAPLVYGNDTFFVTIHREENFVKSGWVDFREGGRDYFGTFGAVLGALIVLVLILMAISEGAGIIIFAILGLIIITIMQLVDLSWMALVSIICAGGIIMWKLIKRRGVRG